MEQNQEISKPYVEKEVNKEEFKAIYMKNATLESGYSEDHWNALFEKEEGKIYIISEPATSAATSMCISSGNNEHRIYFLTEESTESLYDFPGKD